MDFALYFKIMTNAILKYDAYRYLLPIFVMVLLVEMPYYGIIFILVLKSYFQKLNSRNVDLYYYPSFSVIITCYSEGKDIEKSIETLIEQCYPGKIEIFAVVDGATQNKATLDAAKKIAKKYANYPQRKVIVVPKYVRGGRVSSLNTGLKLAHGEIIMALDGDTSCDNQTILYVAKQFQDSNVVASSGGMRVRNAKVNLVTKLQSLEYVLGIHLAKLGLAEVNSVNNISGAFGFFRHSMLKQIGGWRSGSAEDLDLTTRLQSLFSRHPKHRIAHTPEAMSHTDAPESWKGLFLQRLRWDGDMFFIWIRRYRHRIIFRFMSKSAFFVTWGGLIFNLVVPLAIIIYIPYTLFNYPIEVVFWLFAITYIYYLIITVLSFVIMIALISERPAYDLYFVPYLVLMPLYQFIMRAWTGVAIIYELVLKTHNYSSMAPWWVLKNKQ